VEPNDEGTCASSEEAEGGRSACVIVGKNVQVQLNSSRQLDSFL